MTDDRYQDAERVFRMLIDVEPDQRQQKLKELGLDEELEEIVRGMLHASDAEFDWLPVELPEHTRTPASSQDDRPPAEIPTVEGFRNLSLAGRGGMGSVYRAEQLQPRRAVAIKVLDVPYRSYSDNAQRLFLREIQAISSLHHPNIATVYQLATAETDSASHPCLVMEYLEGSKLTRFAEDNCLTIRERVELFAQVVGGVHHAHSIGIIHRDLSPGNVMVTQGQLGKAPVAKIIDFGIAKIRETDGAPDAGETVTAHHVIGTLPYVAPEQLGIGIDADEQLDHRCDIHALGVILFELLTGQLPYDIRGIPLARAMQRFAVGRPRPLRPCLSPSTAAAGGRVALQDLEAIVARALARSPSDRYPSAADLAADARRWLDGNPVVARSETSIDRVGRFVHHNKSISAMAAALLFVFAAATVISTVLLARTQEAKADASTKTAALLVENERLASMDQFLEDILTSASYELSEATAKQPKDLLAIDLITWVSDNLPSRLSGRPEATARLRLAILESYVSHGRIDQAEISYSLGDQAVEKLDTPSDLRLELLLARARLDIHMLDDPVSPSDVETTKKAVLAAIALAESTNQLESYVLSRNNLTTLLWRQQGAQFALTHAQETADQARNLLGSSTQTAIALNNLGSIYHHSGDPETAIAVFDECIEMRESFDRYNVPHALITRANRLVALRDTGVGDEEMLSGFLDLLSRREAALPRHHQQVIDTRRIVGILLVRCGRPDEAVMELEATALISREHRTSLGWIALAVERELIRAYRAAGRLDAAQKLYESELARDYEPEFHRELQQDHAEWMLQNGRAAEAETVLRELIANTPALDTRNTCGRLELLADSLRKQNQLTEAVQVWTRVIEIDGVQPVVAQRCRDHIEEVRTALAEADG